MSSYSPKFRACVLALVPALAPLSVEAQGLNAQGQYEKGTWAGACDKDESGRNECRAFSNQFFSDAISGRPVKAHSLQLGFNDHGVPQTIHFNMQDYEDTAIRIPNVPEVSIFVKGETGKKEIKLNAASCERPTDCRYEAPLTPETLKDIYAAQSLHVLYVYKRDGKLTGVGQAYFDSKGVQEVVEYLSRGF